MDNNWYIVLGLEVAPNPVQDINVIERVLSDKKKEWAKKSTTLAGAEAQKNLDRADQMLSDMKNPDIRNRLLQEALQERNKVFIALDKDLQMVGHRGPIPKEVVKKLVSKHKLKLEEIEKRIRELDYRVAQEAAETKDYKKIYDQYYGKKPDMSAFFEGINKQLTVVSKKSVYAYLDEKILNPSKLEASRWLLIAEEIRAGHSERADAKTTAVRNLHQACLKIFDSEQSKADYDTYLEYLHRKEILDEAKASFDLLGELPEDKGETIIIALSERTKNRELSMDILMAYCREKNIPYAPIKRGDNGEDYRICRCGFTNDISDGKKTCVRCGLELFFPCPNCNTVNDATVKVCSCGFDLENIERSRATLELAEAKANALQLDAAEMHLRQAEIFWDKNPRIPMIKKIIGSFNDQIGKAATSMHKAMEEKRFVEAKEMYKQIQRTFPEYNDRSIHQKIDHALEKSKILYDSLANQNSEKEIVETGIKIYEICTDYPEISRILAKYPPEAARDLTVGANQRNRMNTLHWKPSPSEGMLTYVVLRKQGTTPVNSRDGDVIVETSATTANDTRVEPGVPYYYGVFVLRGGQYSRGAVTAKSVLNLFELAAVNITASDGQIHMTWEEAPPHTRVLIYQIQENLATLHGATEAQEYGVAGLENDRKYQFRVALEYDVLGEKKLTIGQLVEGTPIQLPSAILDVRIKKNEQNDISLQWTPPLVGNTLLYYSETPSPFSVGQALSKRELEEKMKLLPVLLQQSGYATLRTDKELIYGSVVVEKSGTYIVGKSFSLSVGGQAEITSVREAGTTLYVSLKPPKKVQGFVLAYRHDEFPQSPQDSLAVREEVNLKSYTYHNALMIKQYENKPYYITVFSKFLEGGQTSYCSGSTFFYDGTPKQEITYSIRMSKKLFGKSVMEIRLRNSMPEGGIPALDFMIGVGVVPMFKESSEFLFSSEESTESDLLIKKELPDTIRERTFLKPFIKKPEQQGNVLLKIATDSSNQIK